MEKSRLSSGFSGDVTRGEFETWPALHISNPEIDSERLFNGGKTAFLVDPITSPSDGIAPGFFFRGEFFGQ